MLRGGLWEEIWGLCDARSVSDAWGQIILMIQMFGIWHLNCVFDWWIALLSYRLKGLIIDAFGELRDQQEQVKEDMEVSFHSTSDLTILSPRYILNQIYVAFRLVFQLTHWINLAKPKHFLSYKSELHCTCELIFYFCVSKYVIISARWSLD